MKNLISKFFHLFGLQLTYLPEAHRKKNKNIPSFHFDIDPGLPYEYNQEALNDIKLIRDYTMLPYVNLVTLYEQIIYLEKNNIEGDFVECGVWKGGSVSLMALANLKWGKTRRKIHLFDAFDDLCEPDPVHDGQSTVEEFREFTNKPNDNYSGELKPVKGYYDHLGGHGTMEGNLSLLKDTIKYPENQLVFHKGWFEDTVPIARNTIEKIAILRLDGDLYSSTKTCLEGLFDRVVKGGIVVIDDYGAYEGCRKALNEFIEEKNLKVFLSYSNHICRYWVN